MAVIDAIRQRITKKTRMLDVINPGNPFGAVFTQRMLEAMQRLCLENNIW
jgi:aspartate/methionine/tyrosine aminotransferase